jgi:hypothetical protein
MNHILHIGISVVDIDRSVQRESQKRDQGMKRAIMIAAWCVVWRWAAFPEAVITVGPNQQTGYPVCFDGSESRGVNPWGASESNLPFLF